MCDLINHMNFLVVMDLLNDKLIKLYQNSKKKIVLRILCVFICVLFNDAVSISDLEW
jgi:hypothetical protein